MTACKKLIEVAMPVKEISAESVRDKSIRHGHISTLHLWWARRPLPVCRAVVFASLVFDPLDENCPQAFKDAVGKLLSGPKYRPYDDIPFTAAKDPLEDNLRNRLITFIGKFSDKYVECEEKGKKCPSKEMLSDYSLIKWENKNNRDIINIARKLIWVAHDPSNNNLSTFDKHYNLIKKAENNLYSLRNRHLEYPEVTEKQNVLDNSIKTFLDRMPKVFDPFAGGGAIPLEAARLGCKSYANDLNPVAHIIERASIEFPQKYGKPIVYSKNEFTKLYGEETFYDLKPEMQLGDEVHIPNRLSFDVEYHCKKMLAMVEAEIGYLYPTDVNGNKPVAYYWARVATCANPSCKAKVPLLGQFYLCNKLHKKIHIEPIIKDNKIDFSIKKGKSKNNGWMNRGNMTCPCCGNVTDIQNLKEQFKKGTTNERMICVIWESNNGKLYRLPNHDEINIVSSVSDNPQNRPIEQMQVGNKRNFNTPGWGIDKFGQMFSNRQLLALNTFVGKLKKIEKEFTFEEEYKKAIVTYLAIFLDRIVPKQVSFVFWDITRETITNLFGRQAIPMVLDFVESNPFCNSTGSAKNQVDWVVRYLVGESNSHFFSNCKNTASGDTSQFKEKSINAVITDPPYYDAIAYADLADFFYIWLKRTLSDVFPNTFAFPLTPKTDECTALKHHHKGSLELANNHFETKLLQIFKAINSQVSRSGIISIMFAHQSTEAWSTLCNSILNSYMNITGSWALDSEYTNTGLKQKKLFLTSSVTVSCRPSQRSGIGSFSQVKSAIEKTVKKVVKELYEYGFRGADLLTACFGFAVSEFGKFEKVEKASGDEVTVQELLELAREAAFNAIISDINSDDTTRFYIGWLNLFGFTDADHDDVRRITQIGLNVDINDLLKNHVLSCHGNKQSLATLADRIAQSHRIGLNNNPLTIDRVHRAMNLYSGNRTELISYIAERASSPDDSFWRTVNALAEVLPAGCSDYKLASGLAANRESLLRDARKKSEADIPVPNLFDNLNI